MITTETNLLTDPDLILYLLSQREEGKGEGGMLQPTIKARGRCPVCQGAFKEIRKLGFLCPKCRIKPDRYFLYLSWDHKKYFIYSDKQGRILDSYQLITDAQRQIIQEIEDKSFDPSKYIRSEISLFYCKNLLEKFLSSKLPSIAPSYKTDYKRMVERAKGFFKIQDVRKLRKMDLINFKEYLEKTFKLSGKSLKNQLDLFKTFLRCCMNELEILDKVPPFPKVDYKKYSFKWLLPETQIEFYEIIQESLKPIFAFLCLHGCRPSEARALRCKNINLHNQSITISATFSGTIYREKRKGKGAEDVTIPLHSELLDFLTDRVKSNHPEAYVFINPRTGKHFNKNTLQKEWGRVRLLMNIDKNLRLYDATRHSFASQLVNAGTSIYKVSKLLGHSSVKMTEKYSHSNIENLRADMEKISLKVVCKLSDKKVGVK